MVGLLVVLFVLHAQSNRGFVVRAMVVVVHGDAWPLSLSPCNTYSLVAGFLVYHFH